MAQRTKKEWLVLSFILLMVGRSFSQEFELAGISSVTYPKSGLKDTDNSAVFSFQEFGAFINIPYQFKNEKTVLMNGLGYGWVESSGSNLALHYSDKNIEQLYAVYYQLMFAHKLKSDWSLIINLRPTIASDFKEHISSNDFVIQGAALAMKKVNTTFSIGCGLAYTMRFGRPFAVPVLPLKYEKGKHSISALFPLESAYTNTA
jgi:hypothetical protein